MYVLAIQCLFYMCGFLDLMKASLHTMNLRSRVLIYMRKGEYVFNKHI